MKKIWPKITIASIIFTLFSVLGVAASGDEQPVANVEDSHKILPLKERAQIMNKWLKWRLDNIIPQLMRREKIDMWLVINREYNEDPVYLTMVPEPTMAARRTSILIFYDDGKAPEIKRFSGGYYGIGNWYQGIWKDKKRKQFQNLADFIKSLNPQKIAINTSQHWAFADGLSASLKERLVHALGLEFSRRLVSGEHLCIGWLETRSPQELSVYRHICGIAHDIIGKFFSNKVITPDITTTEEVVWWIRQKIVDLGLQTWFQPSISIVRNQNVKSPYKNKNIILRGDLLHCDVGIVYLGLCTDMQWHAYVCRLGEKDAPAGLKKALQRANRLGQLFLNEFKHGRTGHQVVQAAMQKGQEEGLDPLIYSHPVGFHGHGAGPPMEARPQGQAPQGTKIRGNYPLYLNTVYAIEFSSYSKIPEWNNQKIRIGFEEMGVFSKNGAHYIDGHQKTYLIIK